MIHLKEILLFGKFYARLTAMMSLSKIKTLFLALLFVPALALMGCDSDSPAQTQEAGTQQDGPVFTNDFGGGTYDGPRRDSYVWPDTGGSGDMWQWPDLYSGTPFGCQSDADCFGRQCCATPWGVKVCADSCTL